jgi:hypothetical protein
MPNNKGTLQRIHLDGKERDVVYVIWHTSDPDDRWFVTIEKTGQRAVLKSLIDRRPHPANQGFTQDAWEYEIVDEKTFLRMNAGGLPIPPKVVHSSVKPVVMISSMGKPNV